MVEQSNNSTPNRRRGVPTGAIILIALGILLLLQTTEVVSWDVWFDLWRFWPVIIVAIGINILLGPRMPWLAATVVLLLVGGSIAAAVAIAETADGEVSLTSMFEPLGDLDSAEVEIDFGAGKLTVNALPEGSVNIVEAMFQGREAEATFERRGNAADVRISAEARGFLRRWRDVEWVVSLSRGVELSLDVDGGAADITLDLRDLRVADLDVNAGAAGVEITMPANAGHVNAVIEAGAASIDIIIPVGVAARISSTSGLSSVDIDASRFPKSDGVHESPDYGTNENRVDIDLRVGVSSVEVR